LESHEADETADFLTPLTHLVHDFGVVHSMVVDFVYRFINLLSSDPLYCLLNGLVGYYSEGHLYHLLIMTPDRFDPARMILSQSMSEVFIKSTEQVFRRSPF
jgi:hypothetical protein